MPLVLADTSLWVRCRGRLLALHELVGAAELRACPQVMQELLQGSEDLLRYEKLRKVFSLVPMLDENVPRQRYAEAAAIYLRCREEGRTIRSSVDCLIAATAIAHRVKLLHCDRDFDHIASVTTLNAQRV